MGLPSGYTRLDAWDQWYGKNRTSTPKTEDDELFEEINAERALADTLMSALHEAERLAYGANDVLAITLEIDAARTAWADTRGVDLADTDW